MRHAVRRPAAVLMLIALAAVSASGCQCHPSGCPTRTSVDFSPALDESGTYRVSIQSAHSDYRVECSFSLPATSSEPDCTAGSFGTTTSAGAGGKGAITSLQISNTTLGTLTPGFHVSLVRDEAELRAANVSLKYEEKDRSDFDGCGDCLEAHAKL